MCPACDRVLTPEHRRSDDTWRFPVHRSAAYDRLDADGCYTTRDGRKVTMPAGYRCCESKAIVRPYDYRRAERQADRRAA